MGGIPIPKPSILDNCKVVGINGGRKINKDNSKERFYTWDSLQGEIEVLINQASIAALLVQLPD